MQYLIMYRISTKAPRIRMRKTRRVDVIRINGHRRDWRKENKKGKWKMKKELRRWESKDKTKNTRRGDYKCQEESTKW
jgi:hypothetical protein